MFIFIKIFFAEQKIIDLTSERKLLVAGLEAIIQDLQDMQDITKEKVKKSKSKYRINLMCFYRKSM